MSSAVGPTGDRDITRPIPAVRPGDGSSAVGLTRQDVVARQRERFGGMKFGSCFFGWLTAAGAAVLLTGLLVAIGLGVGLSNPAAAQTAGTSAAPTAGLVAGIALLVVILVSFFCGGYVASRMARFDGVKQGLGVWLWSIIAAIVLTVLGLIAGSRLDSLTNTNAIPAIPINRDALTSGGILTAVGVLLISLIGAILGGVAGLRYHRRVDREGFQH